MIFTEYQPQKLVLFIHLFTVSLTLLPAVLNMALNGRIIAQGALERMKESIMAKSEVSSQNLPGRTENHR
jgi:hypothetical protein